MNKYKWIIYYRLRGDGPDAKWLFWDEYENRERGRKNLKTLKNLHSLIAEFKLVQDDAL